jgi:hypothetical protein
LRFIIEVWNTGGLEGKTRCNYENKNISFQFGGCCCEDESFGTCCDMVLFSAEMRCCWCCAFRLVLRLVVPLGV